MSMNDNSQMSLRRALSLAVLALEHIYDARLVPDACEFCDAARLIRMVLDEERADVDWFVSPGKTFYRIGRGRHKSEYD